jgi:hypothetical protein
MVFVTIGRDDQPEARMHPERDQGEAHAKAMRE